MMFSCINFCSSFNSVSQDESYNEAAQTLLTIGNVGHVSQSTHEELTTQCSTSGKSDKIQQVPHPSLGVEHHELYLS